MKTVLLGSAGQLGRDLASLLSGEVVGLTRVEVDITDSVRLRALIETHRPDAVVNCAAYNLVDRAEDDPATAFAVNAWAPRALAEICRDLDCVLVHFSTDYVFGGDVSRVVPWTIADAPAPVSAYGLSKLTGEYWVRMLCPRHFVIRTCGLYGRWGQGGKGGNFVETMLRLAREGKPLRVVNDLRCCPSSTRDVARGTVQLLESNRFGLHHLTNLGNCTWYEFAREIFRIAGIEPDLSPVSSAEYGATARRPSYSVLDLGTAHSAGVTAIRPWQEALAEYMADRVSK